jgi:L-fuconolactonase
MLSAPSPSASAVDAHVHLWRYAPAELDWISDQMRVLRRDFAAEQVAAELARAGVAGAVAVQARQSLAENEHLLAERARCPAILGVVGWVDLRAADVGAALERYAGRLCGVRHVVQDELADDFLLRADFQRGVALLPRFELTYDLLVVPRQLAAACAFADRNPELRLVLDHLGKPFIQDGRIEPWARDLRELARRPHVWLKASGLVTEADHARWTAADLRAYLDVAFEAFGPDRILFGSDYPVCLLAASYAQVHGVITHYIAALSAAERARVLGDNARAFYRLPRAEDDPS